MIRAAIAATLVLLAVSHTSAQQTVFRAETDLATVGAAVLDRRGNFITDLAGDDFEVLEDGRPQAITQFERVALSTTTAREERRDPVSADDGRAQAADPRRRVFVIYLDTYFTDIPGSHRIQRSIVNLLNRIVGENDLYAVMTPDMSASDLALARKTTTVEGYLSKYWFWGQRGRLYPEDPVEQRYLECYPERGMGQSCTLPGQTAQTKDPDNLYAGVAQEMIQRRREKRVIDGLTDLARYLGGLRDERKAVIAVSNGWLLYGPNPTLTRKGQCDAPPGISRPGTTPGGRLTPDKMKSDLCAQRSCRL